MYLTLSQIISLTFKDLFQKKIRNIILLCFFLTSFVLLSSIYLFYTNILAPILDDLHKLLREYISEVYILNYLLKFKFFYYLLNLFKFLFIFVKFFIFWFIITIIIIPINNFITGFFVEKIFFQVNKLNNYKWKFLLKKYSFFLSTQSSFFFFIKIILINAALLPIYLIFPIANIIIFILVNAYFTGKELCNVLLVQFFNPGDKRLKNFYEVHKTKIYTIGCITILMQLIPILNFIAVGFSTIIISHLILSFFKKNKNF